MLSMYELYDLHLIFVAIRQYPEEPLNYSIVSNIIDVLHNRFCDSEPNQFRRALRTINFINRISIYDFVFVDNNYSYYPLPFLVDENVYSVLISACEEMKNVITKYSKERVSDLADCLHDLPIILTKNNYTIPKQYWNTAIKFYRKKWNNDFLR